MSKDQAARIADIFIPPGDWGKLRRDDLTRRIRRAITTAVRKERERCCMIVKKRFDNKWNARTLDLAGIESEINGGKR